MRGKRAANADRSGNKGKISRESSSAELITIRSEQAIVALMPLSTVHSAEARFKCNEIYARRDAADGSGRELLPRLLSRIRIVEHFHKTRQRDFIDTT